jgi:hypothetical protein
VDASDALVFLVVFIGRLGIPLFIFRYPLPAILAAMVLDAADQTIFQQFTNLNLDNYQSYDKALDIYYLSVAYIATLRNWTNLFAFETGRFLWYYRLVGVTAFELSQWRPLLLIFPNTFEYFFDWYEAVRTKWNPIRLTRRHVIGAAAFIWIFIKLPQEYWIHIAKLDTTDLIKEDILGVPVDTPWGEAISENLWVIPVLLAVVAAIWLAIRWVRPRLPEADWPLTFDADKHRDAGLRVDQRPVLERVPYNGLLEKIALLSLVTVIFSQVLPSSDVSVLQIVVGVAVIITANAFVSEWFARRGTHWRSILTEFAAMAVINLAIALLYVLIVPSFDGEIQFRGILFLVLLLTLIVTLYDRYRPVHDQRFAGRRDTSGADRARDAG